MGIILMASIVIVVTMIISNMICALLFVLLGFFEVQSFTIIPSTTTRISTSKLWESPSSNYIGAFPAPIVWEYDTVSFKWKQIPSDAPNAALQSWNWCRHFVLGLQLCPWTRASLETKTATQLFLVNTAEDDEDYTTVAEQVSERFLEFIAKQPSSMEPAAIFFVIFLEEDWDFMAFYEWFVDLEDAWELEDVIVAPFHPNWEFDGPESLNFEKRSPYPTASLVSAKVVEKAGQTVTELIGEHNEELLLTKDSQELQDFWNASIRAPLDDGSSNNDGITSSSSTKKVIDSDSFDNFHP